MHLADLLEFLKAIKPTARQRAIAETIVREVTTRLELLIAIGLDYLSLNRRSATLSGGESQRIRLSSQIGSGLMGMLYVLDEPSIGLHPKDNVKMIETLKRLRDLGNTVIVVEHDADTIRAADHVLEIGPGPGVHGGKIVAEGPLKQDPARRQIAHRPVPQRQEEPSRRPAGAGRRAASRSSVRGARHNNLKNIRRRDSRWSSSSASPALPGRGRARSFTRSSRSDSIRCSTTAASSPASTTSSPAASTSAT